jgi:hypothetical protein
VKIRRFLPAAAALLAACAGNQIGSPKDYDAVELNRVYPYPSPEELGRQKTEVVLASHYTTELPARIVGESMTAVQQYLLRTLAEAGARVIDRSLDDLKAVRRDMTRAYKARRSRYEADRALISRISRYEHSAHYEPPSGLFKSDEELAAEPGTCTHVGEIAVDIKALAIPTDETAQATFTLHNRVEFEQPDHDEECPIEDARRVALLEEALSEALPCLGVPIKNQFAPRGYIEEHRKSHAGDVNIFKTSLGSRNGAREGLELSIFRVQYMTTAEGHQDREERRIGHAVISDQIGPDHSWVLIDVGNLEQKVLAGDMVRAVYQDSFTAGLGIGKCSDMLETSIRPL